MGLLRKHLIFAGIASFAVASFLSTSNVSADDSFSFIDDLRSRPSLPELLGPSIVSPLATNCENVNANSTISCNQNNFPGLLLNEKSNGEDLWGYEGNGITFVNTEKLVSDNRRIRAANKGEVVDFSMKVNANRYYDYDEEGSPITDYELIGVFSVGLELDESSIIVKVAGHTIPAEDYELTFVEFNEEEKNIYRIGKYFDLTIDWAHYTRTSSAYYWLDDFIYAEDADIEVLYSATVESDDGEELFARRVMAFHYIAGESLKIYKQSQSNMLSEDHQATIVTNKGIIIQRLSADGNPVEGAKYAIDGIKGVFSESGVYRYSEDGGVEEFITDANGNVAITNLPLGVYTVREIFSPDGSSPENKTITKELSNNDVVLAEYGKNRLHGNLNPIGLLGSSDLTDGIKTFTDGMRYFSFFYYMYTVLGYDDFGDGTAVYDSETNSYTMANGETLNVKKDGNAYVLNEDLVIPYDPAVDTYRYIMTAQGISRDTFGADTTLKLQILVDEKRTATVKFVNGGDTRSFTYNSSIKCYETDESEYATLCKDGDVYIYGTEGYNGTKYLIAKPTGVENEYSVDFDYEVVVIDEIDDKTIRYDFGFPIIYLKNSNRYFMTDYGSDIALQELTATKKRMVAANYLFRTKDRILPEGISNPQTSDVIIKVLAVSVVALLPTITIRRHFSRR